MGASGEENWNLLCHFRGAGLRGFPGELGVLPDKENVAYYFFLDRGLMINPPFRVSYSVTSIMSQRFFFNRSLGNIFYEAIRRVIKVFFFDME
jgi:hypothetical protein